MSAVDVRTHRDGSTLIVRPATSTDYDAVMNINQDVYIGMDYLPLKYQQFVDDPLQFPFLVEKNGKVVAYSCRRLVDDQKTMVFSAARVHPDHQKQGLLKHLDDTVSRYLVNKYPTIQCGMWTASDKDAVDRGMRNNPEYRLVTERPHIYMDFSPRDVQQAVRSLQFQTLLKDFPCKDTQMLTPSEAVHVLMFDLELSRILPEGRWIVNWEPWSPYGSNYDIITEESKVFVTREVNTKRVRALSFGTYIPLSRIRYVIDFYCLNYDKKPTLAVAHILKHILYVNQLNFQTDIAFSMVYPLALDGKEVKRVVRLTGLLKGQPWHHPRGFIVDYDVRRTGNNTASKL